MKFAGDAVAAAPRGQPALDVERRSAIAAASTVGGGPTRNLERERPQHGQRTPTVRAAARSAAASRCSAAISRFDGAPFPAAPALSGVGLELRLPDFARARRARPSPTALRPDARRSRRRDARRARAAGSVSASSSLPRRNSAQPMLSRMNGSSGESLCALLDQREALRRARRAVDERVAERVERLRVVGLQLDELAQARFGFVDAVELLGDHRGVVEEVGRLRELHQRLRQHRVRAGVVVRVAQQLRLGLPHLDALRRSSRRAGRRDSAAPRRRCPCLPIIAAMRSFASHARSPSGTAL